MGSWTLTLAATASSPGRRDMLHYIEVFLGVFLEEPYACFQQILVDVAGKVPSILRQRSVYPRRSHSANLHPQVRRLAITPQPAKRERGLRGHTNLLVPRIGILSDCPLEQRWEPLRASCAPMVFQPGTGLKCFIAALGQNSSPSRLRSPP